MAWVVGYITARAGLEDGRLQQLPRAHVEFDAWDD